MTPEMDGGEDGAQTVRLVHPGENRIPQDTLRIKLEIYDETILLHQYSGKNRWVRTVNAQDIAAAITQDQQVCSGVLSEQTCWWKQTGAGELLALWEPPAVWEIDLQVEPFEPPERYTLPMPGLVFIHTPGQPPWVLAAKQRPRGSQQELFHTPTFNVFRNGRVCPGSHQFPMESSRIPQSFFESRSSLTGDSRERSHAFPESLLDHWKSLEGQPEYPMDDLIPWGTVERAMRIPN